MRSISSRAARICRPQRRAGRLAASVQSEPADLFVVIEVVKVIALIVKHRMRYLLPCCVDAGGVRVSNS
jgi:hypothetical protein